MADTKAENPKVFISYSWTSEPHKDWVADFAERLMKDGVRVILDQWDLKEGQDKFSFMEQMVHDDSISRVLIICDEEYTRKANNREGGVGTESQIISPVIYEAEDQEKFVPIVTEKDEDGVPYKPTYLEGRIHLDFASDQEFEEEYEKLIRNLFGKPMRSPPPIGEPPAYVTEDEPIHLRTSSKARAFEGAVRNDRPHVRGSFRDYTDTLYDALAAQRLDPDEAEAADPFDEIVVDRIERWKPYRNEYVELVEFLCRYSPYPEWFGDLHRFFERTIPFRDRPKAASKWAKTWSDPVCFLLRELFHLTAAICIRAREFTGLSHLLDRLYFVNSSGLRQPGYRRFDVFDSYQKSLEEFRNNRLELRRLSLAAELLNERANEDGPEFRLLIDADLILFARSVIDAHRNEGSEGLWSSYWYPRTIVYHSRGGQYEIVRRLESAAFFEDFKCVLGVDSKTQLTERLEVLPNTQVVSSGMTRLNASDLGRILNVEEIATVA